MTALSQWITVFAARIPVTSTQPEAARAIRNSGLDPVKTKPFSLQGCRIRPVERGEAVEELPTTKEKDHRRQYCARSYRRLVSY